MNKIVISFLITLFLNYTSFFEKQNSIMEKARRNADAVLKRSNVSARKDIDVVFHFIDLLLQENQLGEAEQYLSKALKHYPWNLKYQLHYAELLEKAGKKEEAKKRALLVYTKAEDEELISNAGKILGKNEIPPFPKITKMTGDHHCVVLIPLLSCNRYIIRRLKNELSAMLKIPVVIQEIETEYPPYKRDRYKRFVHQLRQSALKHLKDNRIVQAMNQLNMTRKDLADDDYVVQLYRHILGKTDKKELKKFNTSLQFLKGKNPQWSAKELCNTLYRTVKQYRRKNVAYLAVTSVDIYENEYNYLFGWANRYGGIMSYHRFTADFNDEPPNQDRLMKRTLMQCLASVGHIYGVKRCSCPTCARAYPNSLAEHDAKDGTLCPDCKRGFEKVFKNDRKSVSH